MKILVIHNHYLEKGGEDGIVESEIKLLKKSGYRIIFYERSNKEIKKFGFFKKWQLLTKDIIWSKETYKEIKALVRQEKPDIAHIHNIFVLISPSIYYALSEEKIPIVQTLHNYRFFCPNGIFYKNGKICEECIGGNFIPAMFHKCWRNSYFLSYFLARALRVHFKNKTFKDKINCYIALSEFSKSKFIEAGLPGDKIFIKPNFVDARIQERTHFENYALFVGRLADYKGIHTVISAYEMLNDCYLKIIGNGPLYKQMQKKTNKMNNVELIGRVIYSKVIEYMRKARFVIFASECYENMPRVIIESFACSVPVIASRLGAGIELIKDGQTGLHFTPGDTGDLASKINWAWENPKQMEEMGKQAKREYEMKYTPQKNFQHLIKIYSKVREIAGVKIDCHFKTKLL